MPTLRCKRGEMARVARSTTGCECTRREIGRVIYCSIPLVTTDDAALWVLRRAEQCRYCGCLRDHFLDADLDPIRPPPIADTTKTDESKPVEVEHG